MTAVPVRIEGLFRDLLVEANSGMFALPQPSFARLADGVWGEYSLAGWEGRLSGGKDGLTLFIKAEWEDLGILTGMMDLRNQPASIILADESLIEAALAHMTRIGDEAEVQLYHWSWRTAFKPVCWVGELVAELPHFGNMRVNEKGPEWSIGRHGCALEGRYGWYLLPMDGKADQKNSYLVVLDPRSIEIEREALRADLLAMQFAFGVSVKLDSLLGLDAERRPVAAISTGYFVRDIQGSRAPVPDFLADGEVWPPELFRRLALQIQGDGLEPLIIAITSYLDSASDHLDGAYLKAQVGLEAFAKRMAARSSPELVVKDATEWKNWVESLRDLVKQKLLDPGKTDMVLGKFSSAMHAPSGELVAKVLSASGIKLPKEITEEIRKRNYPAHGFLMNKDTRIEIDRDSRRLEIVQTLIGALVALHVGYTGPLRGYDPDEEGSRPSPDWWPVRAEAEDVFVEYLAERSTMGPRPGEKRAPPNDRISEAAYLRWLARGRSHGQDLDDWLQAEQELRAR